MAPLIWHLIGSVNLSGSVAEAKDAGVVYLHMYMYSYATFHKKKTKLNFFHIGK
jgi:hypothetical protein